MSDGRVFHVGCPGELVWRWPGSPAAYVCDCCGAGWDGREHGIAEYRQRPEMFAPPAPATTEVKDDG